MSSKQKLRFISFDDQEAIRAAIRNHETFEIGGCHGRMDEAVLFVERAIGSEGMTSRVYTKGRTAAALVAGVAALPLGAAVAAGLAAHNLTTLSPDYEVMKRPVDKALRLTYVKDDPTLGERISDASSAVGRGISDAAKTTTSTTEKVAKSVGAAMKTTSNKVISTVPEAINSASKSWDKMEDLGDKVKSRASKEKAAGLFNNAIKKEAITALRDAQIEHEALAKDVGEASVELFSLRRDCGEHLIVAVEEFVNSFANSPKEFGKSIANLRSEFDTFGEIVTHIEEAAKKVSRNAGAGVTAGVAAGVGVATFAPSAAMAIATTFGTASTGAAISGLSGVAATNAALAWLGGGAMAAGGSGMVAGQALLALAGPVGWTIGGTTLVASGLYARSRNRELADDAVAERVQVDFQIAELVAAKMDISHLITLTKKHSDGVVSLLEKLEESAPSDYSEFSSTEKELLAALINHLHSLSELMNKKV